MTIPITYCIVQAKFIHDKTDVYFLELLGEVASCMEMNFVFWFSGGVKATL